VRNREEVLQKFAAMNWAFAPQDPAAFLEIARRVADIGRRRAPPCTYSELVKGIDFYLPTVGQGQPIRLGVPEWIDLHRSILGDFLGYLCMRTYQEGGFMGSALVVSANGHEPSEGYRKLMRELGYLGSKSVLEEYWVAETIKAYDWYASHPASLGIAMS
jgi:hypothetical protein